MKVEVYLDDIGGLGGSNPLELDLSFSFNFFESIQLSVCEECNACSLSSGSGSSSRSMDVGINVLGGSQLHNEVDMRDIKSSSGHIGGNHTFELSISESLEGDLSLLLGDVSVKDL